MTRLFLAFTAWSLVTSLAAPPSASGQQLGYPRTACYGSMGRGIHSWHGDGGRPLRDSLGRVNMDEIRELARFDVVVLPASPALEHPEVLDSLRAQDTGTRILGAVSAQVWWNPYTALDYPDTARTLDRLIYRSVTACPRWATVGRCGFFDPFYGANCINPDRYTWAMVNYAEAAVADSFAAAVGRSVPARFDGVFVDLWHPRYGYMQGLDSLNLATMGWPGPLASYDSASIANHARATAAIAARAPLTVNGVNPAEDGWSASMRENFPYQWGGSWTSNMLGPDNAGSTGYLNARAGSWLNVLLCAPDGTPLPERARIVRFAFASAALGEGYPAFTCTNDQPASDDRADYWPEEAAVDLATHRPSRSLCARHWLGQARGPAYPWAGLYRRDFDHGSVFVNGTAGLKLVRLERDQWRIAGSDWPNTGIRTWYVMLPAGDAVFLLNQAPTP